MIKSCSDCTNVCCRTGAGPYKLLSPNDYLENFGTSESYNTQCAALDKNNKCSIWGTKEFPTECRTHVCSNRSFTRKELLAMDRVDHERDCSKCGASYILSYIKNNQWRYECENCGYKYAWQKIPIP